MHCIVTFHVFMHCKNDNSFPLLKLVLKSTIIIGLSWKEPFGSGICLNDEQVKVRVMKEHYSGKVLQGSETIFFMQCTGQKTFQN